VFVREREIEREREREMLARVTILSMVDTQPVKKWNLDRINQK
jgi:hypothetical protein